MIKRYFLFLIFVGLGFSYQAMAQCTPDPNCTDPEGDGEFCPKTYPNAVENVYFDQTTTIICPTKVQGQSIHHIRLVDVSNTPAGVNYQCQDNDCNFYPGVGRCINVYGTPAPGSWGYYRLHIKVEAFIKLAGMPISVGIVEDSSAVIFVEPYLKSDFDINFFEPNVLCYQHNHTVSYTGNAEPSATYHWNFGEHATVVSGEGQGPYTIRYNTPFDAARGADSITLYVEQEAFTSAVSSKVFTVTECLGVEDIAAQQLLLSPNPCSHQLKIQLMTAAPAHLRVYNLSGQLMHQCMLQASTNFVDVSTWAKGMYFVRVDAQQGTYSQKFVKQ